MKIEFDQIIALVVIGVATGLYANGIDGEMKSIITVAAGYAFGSGLQARRKRITRLDPEDLELVINRLKSDADGKVGHQDSH